MNKEAFHMQASSTQERKKGRLPLSKIATRQHIIMHGVNWRTKGYFVS